MLCFLPPVCMCFNINVLYLKAIRTGTKEINCPTFVFVGKKIILK